MGRWYWSNGIGTYDGQRRWILCRLSCTRLPQPHGPGPRLVGSGPRVGILGHGPSRMGSLGLGPLGDEALGTLGALVVKAAKEGGEEDALVLLGTRLGLARQRPRLEVAVLGHRHPRLGLVGMVALELRPSAAVVVNEDGRGRGVSLCLGLSPSAPR